MCEQLALSYVMTNGWKSCMHSVDCEYDAVSLHHNAMLEKKPEDLENAKAIASRAVYGSRITRKLNRYYCLRSNEQVAQLSQRDRAARWISF